MSDANWSNVTGFMGIYDEESSLPDGLVLGAKKEFADGRLFRLCKAGEALTIGYACRVAEQVTNHQDNAVAAASIGDETITVTLGATEATANQYKDGFVLVRDDGVMRKIKSHPAADSAATLELTLYDALDAALDGDEKVDLIYNKYDNVLMAETDLADKGVCAPLIAVTSGYYFWGQVRGQGPACGDDTFARGAQLTFGNTVPGQVEIVDADAEPVIAHAISACGTAGDYVTVDWCFE